MLGVFGAPPILVSFGGDWDVHWGYGSLTHGHVRGATEAFPPNRRYLREILGMQPRYTTTGYTACMSCFAWGGDTTAIELKSIHLLFFVGGVASAWR